MAHYDLEEQEQIDSLKTWWKMYGNLVTAVVAAVALATVGWQGWNWYRNNQAGQAAAIFAVLEDAFAAGDAQKVKTAAGELTEKFAGTSHAALGALLAARQSFDAGDLKTARTQLAWVVDNGRDEVRDLARFRLAAVLLDEQQYDEALKQLAAAPAPAFAARFQELRGDVLVAQGNRSEARAAYRAAFDQIGEAAGVGRELLQQKLDSLGEAA
ncbi:MAG: tetratricopeptide repeat protein [Azonexus sp.]|jgi:predicted negative regulator of RcsB-dependent stress response|uniref:YfgM family protein n=1 Tax=Azonexus sp. TaxID=1872668 RepID=UPI002833EF64|nr:tetratricopeptide repeat protein [Azonexus sp.]MDR0775424.1 tetratricopeptide repeat protein [Azonexus sp.]